MKGKDWAAMCYQISGRLNVPSLQHKNKTEHFQVAHTHKMQVLYFGTGTSCYSLKQPSQKCLSWLA